MGGIVAVRQPDGSIVYDYDTDTPGIQGRRKDNYASHEEYMANDPYMVERNRRATEALDGWRNYGSDQAALEAFTQQLNGDPWWQGRLARYYDDGERGVNKMFRQFGTAGDDLWNARTGVFNRYRALRNGGLSHSDIMNNAYPTSPAYTPSFNPHQLPNAPATNPRTPVDEGSGTGIVGMTPQDREQYLAICEGYGIQPDPAVLEGATSGSRSQGQVIPYQDPTYKHTPDGATPLIRPPSVSGGGGDRPQSYSLFSPENQTMRDFISQRLQNSLFGKRLIG